MARSERAGAIVLMLIVLLLISGGLISVFQDVVQQQATSRLAAAPVCAPGQQHTESAGCKLEERVKVTDFYTEEAGRSGYVTQNVKVQAPDGTTYTMYSSDNDFGLWSRLHVNDQVNAELWEGNVVRLDDGAGHYMVAGDSQSTSLGAGVLLLVMGGLSLGLFVRRYLLKPRPRYSNR